MIRHKRLLIPLGVVLALAPMAFGQGAISQGDSRFEYLVGTNGPANYSANSGLTDHLFQNWWYFRIAGDNFETPFAYPPPSQTYAGSNASLGWSFPRFSAGLDLSITDGPGFNQAQVVGRMTIQNTSTSPLTIDVFNYVDYDVGGDFSDDSATLTGPGEIRMRVTDGGTSDFAEFLGVNADAYQVLPFAQLRTLLEDFSLTNLNNSGLPFFSADFTGAYQWTRTIPAGGSATIIEGLSVNMLAVPEPASLALLGLAGLFVIRRR